MKCRGNKRPEPRTQLIGLNLTDDDLAQLDELFASLKRASARQAKRRPLTRSTVAYVRQQLIQRRLDLFFGCDSDGGFFATHR
jgi:cytochrome c553